MFAHCIDAVGTGRTTIRCGALSGIDELLGRQGVAVPVLCERTGVDPAALCNPNIRVEVRRYIELLEVAAQESRNDTLGLRLGYHQPLTTLGPLAEMYLAAQDVESSIRVGIDFMHVHQEGARLHLSLENGLAVVSYSVRDPGLIEYRQDAELAVAKMLRFARTPSRKPDWAPTAVYFEHPAPRDTSAHRRLFGAPVYFSQERNGLAFPQHQLRTQVLSGREVSPARQMPAAPRAPSLAPDLVGDLRLHILKALRQGEAGIDSCASAFGLSRRTFQRRLAAAGVFFEDLVELIRYEAAQHYLKQLHLSLTEIGYLLGYAELSNFSRAFRRWSGASPQEFRHRYASGDTKHPVSF